ncbi:MAG: dihydropteroate synthase [Actinomycetales bacterium]|jgi:5-methyltetrahydrofolate--homocysteine methyltransferase|nr:dihydropteroate synthase [Actinomycetales bacterium]
MQTVVTSPTKTVIIGDDNPFCIIGERINPTGRRIFQEQVRAGDLSAIIKDVKAQVEGGADMLDVNMGVPLTDEADLMRQAIKMVQDLTDLPICIDSSVLEALEAGLQTYQGRALVNSTTGEDDRLDHILPLVKKYDAAIIALPNDETEIPMTVEDRLKITEKILRACDKHGISHDRLVIDPLAMPIGAEPQAGNLFFDTVYEIKERWDLNMTCGASNVSFGMPNRHAINAAFLPAAMAVGLTSAVMDARTPEIVSAVRATDILLGNDQYGGNWITRFRKMEAAAKEQA